MIQSRSGSFRQLSATALFRTFLRPCFDDRKFFVPTVAWPPHSISCRCRDSALGGFVKAQSLNRPYPVRLADAAQVQLYAIAWLFALQLFAQG